MNSYDQKSRNKCLQFSQFFWSNFVDNSVWSEFLAYRCSTAAPCHPSVRPSILEISYQMVYFNITTNILPSLWSILVRSTHTHTHETKQQHLDMMARDSMNQDKCDVDNDVKCQNIHILYFPAVHMPLLLIMSIISYYFNQDLNIKFITLWRLHLLNL